MEIYIQENEKEILVKFSSKEIDQILRKEIRKVRDEKMMSIQQLKMMKCYKKDSINIKYSLDKNSGLIVTIKEG